MRPILFQWRGLTIHSYPAMLYFGLVAGMVAGDIAAHVAGIDPFRTYVALMILTVPALLGSRLLHVVLHWPLYRENPRRILSRNEPGGAQYGGLPLILPISVPLLAALNLPLGAFWDVAMFTILVTMIFGRVGCLLHGCCCGRPSQSWWAMYLPGRLGAREKRIPTQLLEAAWGVVLLVGAMAVWRHLPFPGALFLAVTAGYASGRLVLESLRQHEPAACPFNVFHGLSLALVVLSLAVLAAHWPK
jgi:phosphatidylglycerol---prolipoprotein diacylglyceryl transferase